MTEFVVLTQVERSIFPAAQHAHVQRELKPNVAKIFETLPHAETARPRATKSGTKLFAKFWTLWPVVTLTLRRGQSKPNRLVPGLCPTITWNITNIWSVVFEFPGILLTDKRKLKDTGENANPLAEVMIKRIYVRRDFGGPQSLPMNSTQLVAIWCWANLPCEGQVSWAMGLPRTTPQQYVRWQIICCCWSTSLVRPVYRTPQHWRSLFITTNQNNNVMLK